MSRCTGWLLSFGGGSEAAIGQRELLHLIDRPELHAVPCAPEHCRRVLIWDQGFLPVFDLGAWSDRTAAIGHGQIVAVVGFKSEGNGATEFGGLLLDAPPRRIDVDDDWACPLPQDRAHWRPVSCSCFENEGKPLPVLDLERVFTLDPTASSHRAFAS